MFGLLYISKVLFCFDDTDRYNKKTVTDFPNAFFVWLDFCGKTDNTKDGQMKKIYFVIFLSILCTGCTKDKFNLNKPDVDLFVKQLKNGTYNLWEKGEKGENLWLLMPAFNPGHISALLEHAKDTSHINEFPINPISSRRPFPEGREYFILSECLLWIVEGIRNGYGYGSLDPYMIDTSLIDSERFKGLRCNDILIVRDIYKEWWDTLKDDVWQSKDPLEETSYRWF